MGLASLGTFTLAESDTGIDKNTMVNLLGLDLLSIYDSVPHDYSALAEEFQGMNTPLKISCVQ